MARTRDPVSFDGQREMILARAAQLFAQRGFAATSMNDVAAACGISKPTIYHYVRDKNELAARIAQEHVQRLEALLTAVEQAHDEPEARLRALILAYVQEYRVSQNAHRVLTEDVRFLPQAEQRSILDVERRVVAGFARVIAAVRGGQAIDVTSKPLAMLLFGMINWMFTWLKPDGELDGDAVGTMVAELYFGGVRAVGRPAASARPQPGRA